MKFSDNAMSAILLCSYIGIRAGNDVAPLTLGEWNAFLDRLYEEGKEPGIVLEPELKTLKKMQFPDDFLDRVCRLVFRGASVAFELDELGQKGVGVITQFDADYPVLMKRRLKKKVPPVLFFAGDIQLAKKVGIAIVGSRNVDQAGIGFAQELAKKAAVERLIIYSGGAKGVDTVSETATIQAGGAAVCFLADSILARIKKKEVMDNILQGKLLLLSDVKPETGFTPARAMNRNKYIYASSYGAFVVASDYNRGGTWNGAVEAIRNGWSKVFVWSHGTYEGNQKLLEKGGIAYELSSEKIYDVITRKEQPFVQLNLFHMDKVPAVCREAGGYLAGDDKIDQSGDIYDCVKGYIAERLKSGMDVEEASRYFNVAKRQMTVWLKRMREDQLLTYEGGIYSGR